MQAAQAVLDMNGSELDGRYIMVREDREDRDAQRGRTKGPGAAPMESSGLQVPTPLPRCPPVLLSEENEGCCSCSCFGICMYWCPCPALVA